MSRSIDDHPLWNAPWWAAVLLVVCTIALAVLFRHETTGPWQYWAIFFVTLIAVYPWTLRFMRWMEADA